MFVRHFAGGAKITLCQLCSSDQEIVHPRRGHVVITCDTLDSGIIAQGAAIRTHIRVQSSIRRNTQFPTLS